MSGKYILDDAGTPVRCDDLFTWARWYEDNRPACQVALDDFDDGHRVSTIFLGLDHNFSRLVGGADAGPPILYETMAFGDYGAIEEIFARYSTREEALAGHAAAVERLRAIIGAAVGEDTR